MDKLFLRAIRIAAKNKLPDRWIHSQWYQPLDAEEAGTTFVLIEVVNPWFPAPQIMTTITNTFNREYFRARRFTSATDSFEAAVRKVNEALANRAEEGETDWIGNLHATLAVVAGSALHFVQAGKGQAFIFRNGALSPVAEPKPSAEPPLPTNTFTSIVTGALEPGDKGILLTPDLLHYLTQEELARALNGEIEEAAKNIVRVLQEKRIKTPHAVLFDLAATPHPKRPQEEETVFLDVPLVGGLTRARQAAGQVVGRGLTSGLKVTGTAAGWFWGKTRGDFFPALKQGLSRVARGGKEGVKEAATKAGPAVSLVTDKTKGVLSRLAAPKEGPKEEGPPQKERVRAVLERLAGIAWSIKLRSRFLFISLALVLVVVLGLRVITYRNERQETIKKEAAQASLAAAQEKKEEGDLSLIYKEIDRAVDSYVEALTLAKKAKEHPAVQKSAEEVIKSTQASLDSLTKTERLTFGEPYAQFSNPQKLVLLGKTPWTVDEKGEVSAAPSGQERQKSIALSGLRQIVGLAVIAETETLYAVGKEAVGMARVKENKGDLLSPPEGGWPETAAVESYGKTLYFMDKTAGQIWKYATTPEGISPAPAGRFFPQKEDLTDAVDLAIDGAIYVLFSDGSVKTYFKGVAQDFSLSGLPKPYEKLVSPTLVATDAEAAGLYVVDASDNRIIEFDKKGVYRRQFALPENWQIKDLRVSGAGKKLYVLAGNDVYEIAL